MPDTHEHQWIVPLAWEVHGFVGDNAAMPTTFVTVIGCPCGESQATK